MLCVMVLKGIQKSQSIAAITVGVKSLTNCHSPQCKLNIITVIPLCKTIELHYNSAIMSLGCRFIRSHRNGVPSAIGVCVGFPAFIKIFI